MRPIKLKHRTRPEDRKNLPSRPTVGSHFLQTRTVATTPTSCLHTPPLDHKQEAHEPPRYKLWPSPFHDDGVPDIKSQTSEMGVLPARSWMVEYNTKYQHDLGTHNIPADSMET